jgi:hypothetical protein
VNVSFPLHFKGGETARIAVISLLCLGLVVENIFVILDGMREKFRSAEAPELAYANAGHNAIPCISLKSLRVNLDKSRRLLAVQQPLEYVLRMRGIEHGSHTP